MPSRILVIDDDDGIRDVVVGYLIEAGYAVETAGDGIEGVRLYRRSHAHLVITDIIMPDREGIGTILDLKRLDPQVRIIAMSGGGVVAKEDHLGTAVSLGIRDTLAKPFDREELLATVARALAGPEDDP